jgi:hypothetical protein
VAVAVVKLTLQRVLCAGGGIGIGLAVGSAGVHGRGGLPCHGGLCAVVEGGRGCGHAALVVGPSQRSRSRSRSGADGELACGQRQQRRAAVGAGSAQGVRGCVGGRSSRRGRGRGRGRMEREARGRAMRRRSAGGGLGGVSACVAGVAKGSAGLGCCHAAVRRLPSHCQGQPVASC